MVGYRSDKEALRQRKEVLEDELSDAEAALDEQAEQLKAKDEEIARLRAGGKPRNIAKRSVTGTARRRIIAFVSIGVTTLVLVGYLLYDKYSHAPARLPVGSVIEARVSAVNGPAPIAQSAHCQLTIEPHGGTGNQFNCRLRIVCDGVIVYGPPHGYARCDVSNGRASTASDPKPADGDPAVDYSAASRSVVVWTPDWRVEMQALDATGVRAKGSASAQ